MKIWWNRKYTTIAVYAFLVIAASVLFVLALYNIGVFAGFVSKVIKILNPFIVGFIIAYLLNPGYTFLRDLLTKLFRKKPMPRLTKILSIAVLYLFTLSVFSCLMWVVVPQVIQSINDFIKNFDSYYKSLDIFITNITNGNADIKDLIAQGNKELQKYVDNFDMTTFAQITNFIKSVTSWITSFVLGVVISIYMLYNKEKFGAQLRKIGNAVFPDAFVKKIERFFDRSHDSFGKFISGKILDALVVGCLCFIVLRIFNVDYAILISVIIGVANLIPFFGPIFGFAVSVLLVLMVDSDKVILTAIIILIIQQIDGNFLDPKIVGQKTGLMAFWVIFAVLLGGGFFGVPGILIAVPLFSVLYTILCNYINQRLKKKEMSPDTKDYYKIKQS